jgi:hypothetical protein
MELGKLLHDLSLGCDGIGSHDIRTAEHRPIGGGAIAGYYLQFALFCLHDVKSPSGFIVIAPRAHSLAQMPQPLQKFKLGSKKSFLIIIHCGGQ